MSNLIQPSVFLRRALLADAIVSGAVAALMALGADALQGPLGLPASLSMLVGLGFVPYVAYLVWLATRPAVPRAAVWVPIVLNVAWAIECGVFLASGSLSPTVLGQAFVVVQIVAVLVFAGLQHVGLKRACAIVPA